MKVTENKRVATIPMAPLALLVLTLFMVVTGQGESLYRYNTPRFMTMGTFAQIQLRCRDPKIADEALAAAHNALEQVDRLLSTYREDSEISKINVAGLGEFMVSEGVYSVIKEAQKTSRFSEGAFDITVGPLLDLWRQSADKNELPDAQSLQTVMEKVGYEKIKLTETPSLKIALSAPGMKLNVDAIAKGYAVDCVLAAVRMDGVEAALVDIGGEIACFGQNQPGVDWRIGIQDPFANDTDNQLSQQPRWVLHLDDVAVATSGNYRRFFTIQGKRYSHILDPRTGQPVDALPSVTIIAPTAMQADALATAVSVMGAEKGLALIESLPDTEAFLVAGTPDKPKIYRSSGFDTFEIK